MLIRRVLLQYEVMLGSPGGWLKAIRMLLKHASSKGSRPAWYIHNGVMHRSGVVYTFRVAANLFGN